MASDCRGLGREGRRQVAKRWAREGRRFGKRRARGEAKTLRRSIPSLRATRFRSPAASMHRWAGERGKRRTRKDEKDMRGREREREGRWARRKRKVKIVKGRRMGIEGFPVIIQQGGPAGQVGLS